MSEKQTNKQAKQQQQQQQQQQQKKKKKKKKKNMLCILGRIADGGDSAGKLNIWFCS